MLSIRNLEGEEEGLVDLQQLSRDRKINGEKTISLTVLPTQVNQHSFKLIEEESVITFEDEPYVIKKLNEKAVGATTVKQGSAVHKFFVDLINKQQTEIHDGSITFENYMHLVFDGTGYTFKVIDSFLARSFENLGDDNRLALLKKGLERFKAEMELVGTEVRLKTKVGNDTDFQFRYGHNIQAIAKEVDTTNLATVIRGKGDPELGIEAYYRSPNADIIGEIDAPSVDDERFKSKDALLDEMKDRLQDTPEFSLTIDFADLRAAGYPYTVPNEGDRVFVIYEPMDGLEIETRILEIEEEYGKDFKPKKTKVTLANFKKSFAGTVFDNTSKQLKEIVNDDGVIKYNVLDEAVRIATEALKSAQTELIFENGIIARDKNDPNRLVVYNSEGLGISSDGGQTFREAITSDGFVLTAGAIGRLSANHIQIGPETDFDGNYDPSEKETPGGAQDKADGAESNAKGHADGNDTTLRESLRITSSLPTSITLNANGITASTSNSNAYARLDHRGLYIRGGAILIDGGLSDNQIASASDWNQTASEVDENKSTWSRASFLNADGTIDSSKLKGKLTDSQLASAKQWNNQGTYIDNNGVYTGVVVASQLVSGLINTDKIKVQGGSGNNYTKIDGNFFENKGRHRRHWWNYNKINTVRVMIEDGQIRARNDTQNWSLYFNDWGISTFADGSGDGYDGVASGAIEFHSTRYHASKGLTVFSGARLGLETNGGRIYLNPNGASVRIADQNDNFYSIHAAAFSQSSRSNQKRDIKDLEDNALELINSLEIKEYKRLTSGKTTAMDRWQAGIIVEDAPSVLLADGDSIDIYTYVNYLAKSIQELTQEVNQLKGVA